MGYLHINVISFWISTTFFFLSVIYCTIDMNLEQFGYIANQLTPEECRRLVASLHFTSYELPTQLDNAEKNVPTDVPCLKLLLKWNSGDEKWEGQEKTHVEIERRLRQLGKTVLADWLGIAVFHQLAKDVNDTLLNNNHFETSTEFYTLKLFKETELPDKTIPWVMFDFTLWIILLGLLMTSLILFCRIIYLTSKSKPNKYEREEMKDLLAEDHVITIEDKDNEDSIFT